MNNGLSTTTASNELVRGYTLAEAAQAANQAASAGAFQSALAELSANTRKSY
ncbi:MAG: hypothetical protein HC802_07175 [Caldilineaceae bacterium]|nr:hypothetical protein [Caldilineaceae bacterium]